MVAVTGLKLKLEGTIVIADEKRRIVKWLCANGQYYHYLVIMKGLKYTNLYQLRGPEYDYYYDSIKKTNILKNGRQINN